MTSFWEFNLTCSYFALIFFIFYFLFLFAVMVKHLRWIGHMPIAVGRTRQVNFKQSIYCWFQLFCFLGAFFFSFFLFLFSIVLFFNFSLKSSGHFNIFVGDLSPEVTDATLFACFSVYPSCSWVPHCFFVGISVLLFIMLS